MNLVIKPWESLYRQRRLIELMVRRDLVGRYKGSMAGAVWTIVNPLALLLIYWFVFSVIFRVRFGPDGQPVNFLLYVVAGLLPWMAFSEALVRSNTCIVENPNLVKKVVFPLEVLPVNHSLVGSLHSLVGIMILIALAIGVRGTLPWTIVLLPLVALPQLLFTIGIGWFLASLGVFLRDLSHVIGLILTFWMFSTPIVYPENLVPPTLVTLLHLNPFTAIVSGYRSVLLEGALPEWRAWLYLVGVSLLTFFLGYAWSTRTRKGFADVL